MTTKNTITFICDSNETTKIANIKKTSLPSVALKVYHAKEKNRRAKTIPTERLYHPSGARYKISRHQSNFDTYRYTTLLFWCADTPCFENDVSRSFRRSVAVYAEEWKRDCLDVFHAAVSNQHYRLREFSDVQPFQRFSRRWVHLR